MPFRPIKRSLMGSKEMIVGCPACHKQHKKNRTGEYCTMTCYYAKQRMDEDYG